MRKVVLIVFMLLGIASSVYAQYSFKDCNLNIDLPEGWQKMDAKAGAHGFMNQELNEMLLVWGHPTDEKFVDIDQIGEDNAFAENFVKSNTEGMAAKGVNQKVLHYGYRDFKPFKALVVEKSQTQNGDTIWIREVNTVKSSTWMTLHFAYASEDEMKKGENKDYEIVNATSLIESTTGANKEGSSESKTQTKEKARLSGTLSAGLVALAVILALSGGYKLLKSSKK